MYEDFSIGMPANAAEERRLSDKNGKYYIKNMDKDFLF